MYVFVVEEDWQVLPIVSPYDLRQLIGRFKRLLW